MCEIEGHLPHTIELIIPDRDGNGNSVLTRPVIEELQSVMIKAGFGLRIREELGIWPNAYRKRIYENATIIESSFAVASLPAVLQITMRFAILLATKLEQEAIVVRIDGTMILVPGNRGSDSAGSSQMELL